MPAIFFLHVFSYVRRKRLSLLFFRSTLPNFSHNCLYVRRANARNFFFACFFVCAAKETVFAERDCVCFVFNVFQYPV